MVFKGNFKTLADALDKLDTKIRETVVMDPDRALFGSHPIYDYLSAGYGINLKSVHWEPDEIPTVSHWNDLKHILEKHYAKYMLWEGEPLPSSAANLNAQGIASVVLAPCGNRPADGDFLSVMQQNLASLGQAFQ